MSLQDSYKEFEELMNRDADEEVVSEKFEEILNQAFEVLNKKIQNEEFFDIKNEDDLFVVRSMFDYMLELWANGHIEDAKSVAFDMLYLVEDEKLKESFGLFSFGMLANMDVDTFLAKYVNLEEVEEGYEFFLTSFKDEIDKDLVIKYKDKFKEELEKESDR